MRTGFSVRRGCMAVVTAAAAVASLTLPASAATTSARVAAGVAATSGPSSAVEAHKVTGCGTPMTVYTPRKAGAPLSAQALGLPSGPGTLMAMAAQRHVQWLSHLTCRTLPAQNQRLPGKRWGTDPSQNWSGYEDSTSSPNYAQMFWHIPKVCCVADGPDLSSVWPGIGDGEKGELIQDGTEQEVLASGKASYYFWLERVPAEGEEKVTNLAASSGNSVATDIFWSSTTGAEFGLCNYTLNKCVTGTQASPGPDNHAEWIVERTEICESGVFVLPPLADFGSVSATEGGFDETPQGSLEYTIGQGDPSKINMYSGSKTQIDSTSSLTDGGSDFSVKYGKHGSIESTGQSC